MFTKIKKMSFLRFAAAALIAAFAFGMGACDNPVGSDPSIVTPPIQQPRTPVLADFVSYPTAVEEDDFDLPNPSGWEREYAENTPQEVVIKAKAGRTTGDVVVYYDNTTDPPTEQGKYSINFTVGAAAGWQAVTSPIFAGNLIITDGTPQPNHFIYEDFEQVYGETKAVTIKPIFDTDRTVTPYYTGIEGTSYGESTTSPTEPGTYKVTFDVTKSDKYKAGEKLLAEETLYINAGIHKQSDFNGLPGDWTFEYGKSFEIGPFERTDGIATGTQVVKFDGDTNKPKDGGSYKVTFSVAAANGFVATESDLEAGMLTITAVELTKDDFTFDGSGLYYSGTAKNVAPTVNSDRAQGVETTITYNTPNRDAPIDADRDYKVTLSVNADQPNWKAIPLVWNFDIAPYPPKAEDFEVISPTVWSYEYGQTIPKVVIEPKPALKDFYEDAGTVNVFYNNSPVVPSAVKDYPITFTFSSESHNFASVNSAMPTDKVLTITGKDLVADNYTVTYPSILTYTGVEKEVEVAPKEGFPAKDSIGGLFYEANGATLSGLPVNAGTYDVYINVTDAGNYNPVEGLKVGSFTIAQATLTKADFNFIGFDNVVYDGTEKTVSITNESALASFFKGSKAPSFTGTLKNADTYAITFNLTGDTNFDNAPLTKNLVIAKAPLQLSYFVGNPGGKDLPGEWEYTLNKDTAVEVTVAAKAAYDGIGAITVTNGNAATSGTHTVTFTVAAGTNYEGTASALTAGTLKVNSGSENPGNARLKSLTANDKRTVTSTSDTPPAVIASLVPTTGDKNPSLDQVPSNPQPVNTITISMTSTEYNSGNGLKIKAEPEDSGARIVGFAMGSSRTDGTYTGVSLTDWKANTIPNYSQPNNGGIRQEGKYIETGIPNGEYTFTVQHTSEHRIFVWVKSENDSQAIYRVQTVNGSLQLNTVNTLGSLTVNGVALTPIPAVNTGIPSSAATLNMTTSQYNGGNLVINATTTNTLAKVVGYTMTSDTVTTNAATWSAYDETNGITGNHTLGAHESGKHIYVWVKAESGANGFYRINVVPAQSKVNTISSLKINGVTVTPIPAVNTGIPTASASATISMPTALYNGGVGLKIEAIATDAAEGAKIVGYAMAPQMTTLTEAGWTGANFTYGKYDVTGITGEYTLPGTHTTTGSSPSRIYVWVKAGDTTTNGFYRMNITINTN